MMRWNTSGCSGWLAVCLLAFLVVGPAAALEQACQDGLDNDGDTFIDGADTDCQCVDIVTSRNNNCTAEDVRVTLVGLGTIDDGCLSSSDTVTIRLGATVRTGAAERYDIGIWVGLGGSAKTGALCARQALVPPASAGNPVSCPDPNDPNTCTLIDGDGPFRNLDTDGCGDTRQSPAVDPDVFYEFQEPVTFPCTDTDGNGFLNSSTCASWDNQASVNCTDFSQAVPSTKAKCKCEENTATDIPAPNLAFTCDFNPPLQNVPPGATRQVEFTYTNNASCTPNPSTPEHEQCGTAAYVRYEIDYDETKGTVSGISVTSGSFTHDTVNGVITWTPVSGGGTSGIIGPGQTADLTYFFTVDGAATGSISHAGSAFWSADSAFTSPIQQTALSPTCDMNADTTYAAVSRFEARFEGGGTVVEWETSSEVATLEYELLRWEGRSGTWAPVTEAPVPAVIGAPRGGSYRIVDLEARPGRAHSYLLIERELDGSTRELGPFDVFLQPRAIRGRGAEVETGPRSEPRRQGALDGARFAAARRDATGRSQERQAAGGNGGTESGQLKLAVRESTIHEVSSTDLAARWGVSRSRVEKWIDSGRLALWHRGIPVAWEASQSGIRFFGEAIDSPYTLDNVYWLEQARGAEMATAEGGAPSPVGSGSYRDEVHMEQEEFPILVVPQDPDEGFWYWGFVRAGHPSLGTTTHTIEVPGVAASPGDATLSLDLYGATNTGVAGEHHARVRLNGIEIGETQWSGIGAHRVEMVFPHAVLTEGDNVLEIEGLLDSGAPHSVFYFDALDLAYQRIYRAVGDRLLFRGDGNSVVTVSGFSSDRILVYDVSDPRRPRIVHGTTVGQGDGYEVSLVPAPAETYLALTEAVIASPAAIRSDRASDLRSGNGAEWVAVTVSHLMEGTHALAALRQVSGLSTKVVDLEDVYDEFNGGIASPHALKSFLGFAYQSWSPRPRYVALVGTGSYDYRDLLGIGDHLVPTLFVSTAKGLFASDGSFADVAGGDGVPEMAVGRIPALTAVELASYVEKLQAYDGSLGAPWRDRVVLLADDPDKAGDFTVDSEEVAALLPPTLEQRKVYLEGSLPADVRASLFAELAAGASVLNYVGHGGLDRFAEEGLLTNADVPALGNEGRLPVVTSMTCTIGRFEIAGATSLGEALTMEPGQGAIAVFGPTGLSVDSEAAILDRAFIEAAYSSGDRRRLGDVVLEALAVYAQEGTVPHLIRIYNVIGEPTVELN